MRLAALALLLLAFLGPPAPAARAQGDPSGAISGPFAPLSDADLDRRIGFLEERLDAGRLYARIWQYGFTTGYGLGVVIGGVEAGTAGDADDRVDGIVTATKATIGTGRLLLRPLPSRHGAEPMREVPGQSREARMQRLAVGEDLLARSVHRAESRTDWRPHAFNAALNLAGGGFIWGFGDPTDAAVSTVVGIVVGELMLLTMPHRSVQDLEDYRRRFGLGDPARVSWRLEPFLGSGAQAAHGLALRVDF